MTFSDMDNDLLNAFMVDDDGEDSTPYFNDSVFDFNDYIDSQYEDTFRADSIQEPQKNSDNVDSMNLHNNCAVLADSTDKLEVATQEGTSKGETTNVSGTSSATPLVHTPKPQGLRVDTAVSKSINSSDSKQPTSNPEQQATLEGHSTNSNALLDHGSSNPVSTAEHRSEEAGPTSFDFNQDNDFTWLDENTNQQSLQEGQAPTDFNFSFDGLFDDTNDWNADGVDTSGWTLNDWGIEDGAQGMLPLNLGLGSPSVQANLAHQSNGEAFFNAVDNDASSAQANFAPQSNGESFFNPIDNDGSSAQANLAHQDNGESFFNAIDNDASSAQANSAHQSNAEPLFNAIDNNVSSVPGTNTEPNLHGLLPNINTQGEEKVSAEQSQNSITQSLHQHATPQTLRADMMTTTVAQDIGVHARGIARQYATKQPMKSSQIVATQAGTIAGSPKQQVNRNMHMPAQSTSNDYHQQPAQRNVTGTMMNAHLHDMNGHAHLHNVNGNAHLHNINGYTLQGGHNPNNSHSQQRSKSLPTSEGSSKEEAIDLISPVAATFNDEHATSHAPSGPTPSNSRQPVNNSHPFSGPNSHGSLYSQRSPGSAHQRQLLQMTPRSQSNLRHMSVPAPSMGQSQASTGTGYQISPSQMSSSVARPSIEAYQQLGFLASNGGHNSYSQGYGSNEMAGRILSGRGGNFTGPKVNDLRAQSQSNDATSSQHRLSHSPRSNLGNHRVLTQEVFQSPQQRQLSLLNQPLALQHLTPLQGVPRTSVLPNSLGLGYTSNSMKHETSSPESASGALTKLNQVPQHDSRRVSQILNFQTPNFNLNNPRDQQRIELLYNAMMDMSNPQDNNGMLKTWRGLMKEKVKIRHVCSNILVRCPSHLIIVHDND